MVAGATRLPAGGLEDGSSPNLAIETADVDFAARAAAADRGSRSGSRDAPSASGAMSLAEAAEAAAGEQERLAKAREAEEAAREDRAARARAEALRTRWVSPLETYQLLEPEGEGVGFTTESGAPVRAISSGTIRYAGTDDEYGQMILIEHWDGTLSYYCYLSSFEKTEGEVAAGELIGRVGTHGTTSASHLYLQIRARGGDAVDPLPWLARRGVEL